MKNEEWFKKAAQSIFSIRKRVLPILRISQPSY